MAEKQGEEKPGTKKEMSFLDHLEELRMRLVRSVAGVIAGIVLIVMFDDFVINQIIMGPKHADFISYKAWCWLSHSIGLGEKLCIVPKDFDMISTTVSGNFSAYMLVCVMGGIILAFPFIFYQIWGFIKPGLKQKEVNAVRGITLFVSLLFFTGALFGYFVLAPLSLQFLVSFQFGDSLAQPTVLSYLKLTTSLVLGSALIFQLPVLVLFLSRIGLVTASFLRKYRKHAFVVNLIIAAIITPPDVTSQILVSLPILLLYELSIYLAARVEKKQAAKANN